ncbi:MAG: ATP-binding protein, partial [Actinomycetota bacterium]|nr:ATP-binding protein [Actinomycetota bacterium]
MTEILRWSGAATPDVVALIRRVVVQEATRAGADEGMRERVRLAVSEAVTNVVMHAYRESPAPGEAHVVVRRGYGTFSVMVRDHGIGLRPRADSPGAGLG